MKKIKFLTLFFMLIFITSCSDDNDKSYETSVPIISELPTYTMTYGEEGLLSENIFTQEAVLLKSNEQVLDLLNQNFLEKYPEYLSVDFEKNYLIIATSLITRDVKKRNAFFVLSEREFPPYYELRLYYSLNSTNALDTYNMEIFGLLVEKDESMKDIRLIATMSMSDD